MNHPFEQLADLMDGTLDERELAGVQAHLDLCATCRQDIDLATHGARAARSLPVEDPPPDLHRRVVGADGGGGTPTWYRWAGAAAAAAAVIAIAIALPNVGGDGQRETATDAAGSSEVSLPLAGDVEYSREEQDYDADALQDLARSATASRQVSTNAAGAELAGDTSAAVRCVSKAFGDQQAGRLTRLIQARFEGEEAYIAVYLEGPGAGEPPDTVAVWAASSKDCTVLSFASARI
ncbi:MAG TPA: zf-HC2 domain-containing protein [Actinomycetota bacterium]|nr:zf-HC2 domain-containing protein [Actinomycetota bacterium]HEX4941908.1 zf-HC2 domain-containing protein [Actinomycetota bacterium]